MTDTGKLFTRHGGEYAGAVKFDGETPYFTQRKVCGRCGGRGGSDAWKFTGWTCYECGGSGDKGIETVKLYTCLLYTSDAADE